MSALDWNDAIRPAVRAEHARQERGDASVQLCLEDARKALRHDPDRAAWLLDGMVWRIASLLLARRRLELNSKSDMLALLAAHDAFAAMRVRLALRAPNVAARLAHCEALLSLVADEPAHVDDENKLRHGAERRDLVWSPSGRNVRGRFSVALAWRRKYGRGYQQRQRGVGSRWQRRSVI